jgi:diguanylate cyclase (GGDEF)-like protein
MCFTRKDALLKKWWAYILLYLPAAVTILGFTYFPRINPAQYSMIKTGFGWTNVALSNGWDWFFTIYYVSFSAVSFLLLFLWGKNNSNKKLRRQTYITIISFFLTMIFGLLTDILSNSLLSVTIPQIGPLLMIIPITFTYFSIKKYGLLNPRHADEDQIMMNDQIRTRIISYLSNACIAAALLNVIATYWFFKDADFGTVLLFSGLFVLFGITFQVIHRSKITQNAKDFSNAVLMSLIVPIVTLKFVEFGSMTIWAFPFILLIITLVFGKNIIQITLVISIFLTQILVWLIRPETAVTIDAVDYITRIGMYAIAVWFAFFEKKIYLSRLNENANQISSQKLIAEISTDYISVSENNFLEKTDCTLRKITHFMNVDRAYIYLFDHGNESLTCIRSVASDKAKAISELPDNISSGQYSGLIGEIMSNRIVAVSSNDEVSAEIRSEIDRLTLQKVKSLILLPIVNMGNVLGFLGLDTCSSPLKWRDTQIDFNKIISNILADAVAKVNQEKAINSLAYYDFLTKLPNRSLFIERVNESIQSAKSSCHMVAVIFIDLDSFKTVNDTMGHDGGDSLIAKVSQELTGCVGKPDAVSRFGGDEFLVLINDVDSVDKIVDIADKIVNTFNSPFFLQGQEFFVTASAGVAIYPEDGDEANILIKNADIAMYKAKGNGKNRYMLCTADMKDEVITKTKLSNSLYRALERNEFALHYQPQIRTETNEIIGAEALLRWQHPDMGMIPPDLFIPLAEQSGLIGAIGEWVLKTACRHCKAWHELGLPALRIAVNVSTFQFRNSNLVSQVNEALREAGLDSKYLELEITESIAMNEADYIIDVLEGLKDLGVSISIDDFGTEYSSLSRLNILPIDL